MKGQRKKRKPLKAGRGKRKGAGFERAVCKKLSRFIQPKGKDTLFWRSAMSGGRATIQQRAGIKNTTQFGDITCIHPDGAWLTENFFLECKFLRNLEIQASLLDGRGKLFNFWKKAKKEAKNHDRKPVLIAKENRSRTLLIISEPAARSWGSFKEIDVMPILYSHHMRACVYDFEAVLK